MTDKEIRPSQVQLRLRQHVGAPAIAQVSEGDQVKAGQLVAAIPEGKLGANVHASIDGQVSRIDNDSIWVTA